MTLGDSPKMLPIGVKESPNSKRTIQSVDREADVTLNEQKENPAFSENNEEVSFERIYITID